jgi:hypothetical protein
VWFLESKSEVAVEIDEEHHAGTVTPLVSLGVCILHSHSSVCHFNHCMSDGFVRLFTQVIIFFTVTLGSGPITRCKKSTVRFLMSQTIRYPGSHQRRS